MAQASEHQGGIAATITNAEGMPHPWGQGQVGESTFMVLTQHAGGWPLASKSPQWRGL